MKYILYAVSTIRDVINYNYHKDITEEVLNRIEKELALIEDAEDNPYTVQMYDQFHMDLLNLNICLLPNSQKITDELSKKHMCKLVDNELYDITLTDGTIVESMRYWKDEDCFVDKREKHTIASDMVKKSELN